MAVHTLGGGVSVLSIEVAGIALCRRVRPQKIVGRMIDIR